MCAVRKWRSLICKSRNYATHSAAPSLCHDLFFVFVLPRWHDHWLYDHSQFSPVYCLERLRCSLGLDIEHPGVISRSQSIAFDQLIAHAKLTLNLANVATPQTLLHHELTVNHICILNFRSTIYDLLILDITPVNWTLKYYLTNLFMQLMQS